MIRDICKGRILKLILGTSVQMVVVMWCCFLDLVNNQAAVFWPLNVSGCAVDLTIRTITKNTLSVQR